MEDDKKNKDKLILFPEELPENTNKSIDPPWIIIIADDESEVHQITEMVLSDYTFEGRSIKFLNAYSGKESLELVRDNPGTAVILLDVVMEADDSGLEVAQKIRKDLKNNLIRIILRTGQPGKAPERKVIMEYDINEYKEKTELTTQKLFTTITAALRSYKDLTTIDKTRQVLELVIKSSEHIFGHDSLRRFTSDVLKQILSILHLDKSSMYVQASGFAASQEKDKYTVLAATGEFEKYVGHYAREILPDQARKYLEMAIEKKEGVFIDDVYVGYFNAKTGSNSLLFLTGCSELTDLEKDLIRIFSTNAAIAFDNLQLSQEIVNTQKEVIFTLGELVDTRSKGTAHHVRRVAEFSEILAIKAGLDREEADLLKLASPMHDIGKIGIPDSILNKPGPLSEIEYDHIKTHSSIGYDILKNSERKILKAATVVAKEHHERWDGKGYPKGLKGKEIHIFGRITSLADVFDALTHNRIYKKAWNIERVLNYFKEERGKHFDPVLTDIFLENINEFMEINAKFPEEALSNE